MILQNIPKNGLTQIEMEVNGIPVTGYAKPLSSPGTCRALQREDKDARKQLIWPPNDDGKYDIRIRITDVDTKTWSWIKITSFIEKNEAGK